MFTFGGTPASHDANEVVVVSATGRQADGHNVIVEVDLFVQVDERQVVVVGVGVVVGVHVPALDLPRLLAALYLQQVVFTQPQKQVVQVL